MNRPLTGRPVQPCKLTPQRWDTDNGDHQAAIAECRTCWFRSHCAADAVRTRGELHVEGVIAGILIPPENAHYTSKERRHAFKKLQAIAELGQLHPPGAAGSKTPWSPKTPRPLRNSMPTSASSASPSALPRPDSLESHSVTTWPKAS